MEIYETFHLKICGVLHNLGLVVTCDLNSMTPPINWVAITICGDLVKYNETFHPKICYVLHNLGLVATCDLNNMSPRL